MTEPDVIYSRDIEQILKDLNRSTELNEEYLQKVSDACEYMRGPWNFDPEDRIPDIEEMRRRGREDGRHSSPAKNARTMSETEYDVHQKCVEWHGRFTKMVRQGYDSILRVAERLGRYIEKFQKVCEKDSEKRLNYYDEQISDTRRQLREASDEITPGNDPLEGVKNEFFEKLNLFRDFRRSHNLDDSPSYESNIFIGLLLATCIIGEGFFNAYFYAKASDSGLVGGLIVAMLVSFIICFSGFAAGFCWRWHNAKTEIQQDEKTKQWEFSWKNQILAHVGSLLFSALSVVSVAAACIYRDEASLIAATTAYTDNFIIIRDAVWERLKAFDIIPKADIEGLGLIAVNFLVAGFGAWKGYFALDPVPGHARKAEAVAEKRKTYLEAIKKQEEDLHITPDSKATFKSKCKIPSLEFLHQLNDSYEQCLSIIENLQTSSDQEISRTAAFCKARLHAYREENKKHRPETDPAPSYFNDEVVFDSIQFPPKKRLSHLDKLNVNKVQERLAKHRSLALDEIYEIVYKAYKNRIEGHKRNANKEKIEINRKS